MVSKQLNVLLLEDLTTDAELIKRQVLKAAPQSVFTIARNRAEFFTKIEWSVPDIILADYNLPDINGLEALLHVRGKKLHTPFIFVTGTLNDEEKVADAVLKGASGYVLKENLKQLPTKLLDVLENSESQQIALQEEDRIQREAELSLQKALAKLSNSGDFKEKAELTALLQNVLSAFQH